jgi:hypothetical protein
VLSELGDARRRPAKWLPLMGASDMTGTFKVAEQRGPIGYFGKVDLEVEPDDNINGCEIIFQELLARNGEWRNAVSFGIEYGYSRLPKSELHSKGHRITVRRVQGQPCDTDSLIIAYTAVRALFHAFGLSETDVVCFDVDGGKIVFDTAKKASMKRTTDRNTPASAPRV